MKKFSYIDNEKKDFLRDENNKVIVVDAGSYIVAEDWLIRNGDKYGFANYGCHIFDWEETFKDDSVILLNKNKQICLEKIDDLDNLYDCGFLTEESYKIVKDVYLGILKSLERKLKDYNEK